MSAYTQKNAYYYVPVGGNFFPSATTPIGGCILQPLSEL